MGKTDTPEGLFRRMTAVKTTDLDAIKEGQLAGLREAEAEAESRGDRYDRQAAIAETTIGADDFRAKAVACHRVAAAIRKLIEETEGA